MIVYFNISLTAIVDVNKEALSLCVSEVLRAHRRGYHLIIIDRATSQWFTENLSLSDSDLAAIKNISASYTQLGGLLRSASSYIEITPNSTERIESNSQLIFRININDLLNGDFLAPTVLVVEDSETDGKLYSFILDNIKDKFGVPKLRIDLCHGGGSRIIDTFKGQIKANRTAVCIVDSDLISPSGLPNCKTHRIRADLLSSGAIAFCIISPPGHEAENIIPLSILRKLPCATSNETIKHLDYIQTVERPTDHNDIFFLYFNLKDGLTADDLQKIGEPLCKEWIKNRISLTSLNLEDFSLKGFGDRIIYQIFYKHIYQSELRTQVRHGNWLDVFRNFIDEFIWFFCSNSPQRT